MQCERCKGRGQVRDPADTRTLGEIRTEFGAFGIIAVRTVLCPDCNGSGQGHCCDGICEQPDGDIVSSTQGPVGGGMTKR